jgi:hypothetical protein
MRTLVTVGVALLAGCSEAPTRLAEGGACIRTSQCGPGLACVARRCSSDLGPLAEAGMVPVLDAGPMDAEPLDGDAVDAPPPDVDAGVVDAGPRDAGRDAGMDAGPPELDAGPPELDAGPPELDAGPPEVDAGADEDAAPADDAG